jgi:hypothetical protein
MKKRRESLRNSKCTGQQIASGNALKSFLNLLKEYPKRTLSYSKSTLLIHPSISKRLASFGQPGFGIDHRALAVEDGEDFIWVWIGTHDEYERMIKGLG